MEKFSCNLSTYGLQLGHRHVPEQPELSKETLLQSKTKSKQINGRSGWECTQLPRKTAVSLSASFRAVSGTPRGNGIQEMALIIFLLCNKTPDKSNLREKGFIGSQTG